MQLELYSSCRDSSAPRQARSYVSLDSETQSHSSALAHPGPFDAILEVLRKYGELPRSHMQEADGYLRTTLALSTINVDESGMSLVRKLEVKAAAVQCSWGEGPDPNLT